MYPNFRETKKHESSIVGIVCQNKLPDDFDVSCILTTCDQWAGINEDGTNHCNADWSEYDDCTKSAGKIKDSCQVSCYSQTCPKSGKQ